MTSLLIMELAAAVGDLGLLANNGIVSLACLDFNPILACQCSLTRAYSPARVNSKIAILYPQQFGFRAGHSADLALVTIQELITKAIDMNKFSVGIFLDLAKAFDTVDHKILLRKLSFYGIRGVPLLWFENYLTGRLQQVQCNGELSSFKLISCGVPQGSN